MLAQRFSFNDFFHQRKIYSAEYLKKKILLYSSLNIYNNRLSKKKKIILTIFLQRFPSRSKKIDQERYILQNKKENFTFRYIRPSIYI